MSTKSETLDDAWKGEGCLGRSADDEPVFVVCARDVQGGAMVRLWASGAIGQRVNPDKIAAALRVGEAMDAWHVEHVTHVKHEGRQ